MASIMSSSCPFARELSKWAQLERKEPEPTKPVPAFLGVPVGATCRALPALPSSQWGSMPMGLRGEGECQGGE